MDYSEAIEAAGPCVTQQDLADRLGVNVQRVRQARLASSSVGHRPPPPGWQRALSALIRERVGTLSALADQLDAETHPSD